MDQINILYWKCQYRSFLCMVLQMSWADKVKVWFLWGFYEDKYVKGNVDFVLNEKKNMYCTINR